MSELCALSALLWHSTQQGKTQRRDSVAVTSSVAHGSRSAVTQQEVGHDVLIRRVHDVVGEKTGDKRTDTHGLREHVVDGVAHEGIVELVEAAPGEVRRRDGAKVLQIRQHGQPQGVGVHGGVG